jgi:translocation and assembly module TamB
MRRLTKIFAGSLLLVLLLAVLAVACVHVFLATGPGERFVLDLVNSLIPGRISCGQASISLLGESLEIVNGRLTGPDGHEIVQVGRIKARIDLFALLRRRVVLTFISADSPRVNLVRHRDGSFNIVQALVTEEEQKPEEEGFEFILSYFQAHDGVVGYDDEEVNLRARIHGVGLMGALDFPGSAGWASASVKHASMDLDGFPVDIQETTMRARLSGELLDPVFIEVHRGRYHVAASGFIRELFTRPDFDIVFDNEGEIADLVSLFGLQKAFSGDVQGMVRLRGMLADPDISCRIACPKGKIAGCPVEKLNLAARLKNRVVTVDEGGASLSGGTVSLAGGADLRQAFPEGFLASHNDIQAISYNISANASGLDLKCLVPSVKALPSDVSGKAALKGRGVSLDHLSGECTYDLIVAGIPASLPVPGRRVDLKGRAEFAYPVLDLATSARMGTGIRGDGKGRFDLGKETVLATVSLNATRPDELLALTGNEVRGALNARAKISGPLWGPRVAASVKGTNLQWKGFHVKEALVDAALDESGKVEIPRLAATSNGSSLNARGSIRVFRKGYKLDPVMPMVLNASIRAGDMRELTGREDVRGSLEGSIRLEGALFNPSGDLELKGHGVSFQDIVLGDIAIQGNISQGMVEVPRLEIVNKGSTFIASGRVNLFDAQKRRVRPDPEIGLTATGDIKDLSSFISLVQGSAAINAHIGGSVRNPEGTIQASTSKIKVSGQDVDAVSLSTTISEGRINLENLEVNVRPGQKVTGTGWLGLEKPWHYALSLKSEGISLDSFPVLKKYQVTGGKVLLDISGKGILESPRLKGDVIVSSLLVNQEPHKDVFIHLQMADGKLSMLGESNFGFNGSYDLQTRDLDLQAIFKDTELEPYFRIAGRPELHGVLTGDAVIKGNARNIQDIDLDAHISKVDILLREDRVVSGTNISMGYHDRRMSIPRSMLTLLEQGSMVLQAKTDRNGSIDLSAQGLIPLEIVPLLFPDMEDLMGTVRFGLSLKGPAANLAVTGDLYLDDVSYYIMYNDQLVHNVNGHIRLEGNQAVIQDLKGMLDTGSFSLGGKVALKDFKPVNIDLEARAVSLPITVPDTMNLLIEAKAELRGTQDSTLLTGNALILEGTYYKDVQLNLIAEVGQRITSGRVRAEAPRKPLDLPFLREMELDVTVSRRGNVSIENNLTEATLNPDLQITGTLNDPVITGRVSVMQGTVTYQKNTFDITRGEINFSNPYRTRADVDVSAQGKVRDWTITLEVTGPLDNLNINLSSNPTADNATILSLLATGKTPDELAGRPGTAAASPSNLLAEVLANTYGGTVKKTTGLDIFQLESGTQQTGSQTQDIKITVGEKLTRRLTLKYSVATEDNELTRTTTAEYMLLENILLNGFQDSKGGFGGDVQFRLEFR